MRRMLLLALLITLATDAALAHIYSDADMGIHSYSFIFDTGQQPHELRVHLRVLCPRQQGPSSAVQVKGFAGLLPLAIAAHHNVTVWDPHYKPPELQQQQLLLSVQGTNGTTSKQLMWLSPSHQGLWRLQGRYQPTGHDVLVLNGSSWRYMLPDPRCSSGGAAADAGPQQWGTPGIWNVVTTTSPNSIAPATLALMMAMHAKYHRIMGINGTVLRCNPSEARALAGMQEIQQAVTASQLIIWPWEQEHSVAHMPFYWQKPRNQLTLLAAFGHRVRLMYLDLDEYLVLPQGKPLQASSCNGRPLLERKQPALSFIRYPARSCKDPAVPELVCWNTTSQPLPATSQGMLAVERCPCQFHKPLVVPDKVVTLSVHFVWTEAGAGGGGKSSGKSSNGSPARASYVVPHACGFLLHLHAMVHTRKHFEPDPEHIVQAEWTLTQSGAGHVVFPNGMSWLHSTAECKKLRPAGMAREDMPLSWC